MKKTFCDKYIDQLNDILFGMHGFWDEETEEKIFMNLHKKFPKSKKKIENIKEEVESLSNMIDEANCANHGWELSENDINHSWGWITREVESLPWKVKH